MITSTFIPAGVGPSIALRQRNICEPRYNSATGGYSQYCYQPLSGAFGAAGDTPWLGIALGALGAAGVSYGAYRYLRRRRRKRR